MARGEHPLEAPARRVSPLQYVRMLTVSVVARSGSADPVVVVVSCTLLVPGPVVAHVQDVVPPGCVLTSGMPRSRWFISFSCFARAPMIVDSAPIASMRVTVGLPGILSWNALTVNIASLVKSSSAFSIWMASKALLVLSICWASSAVTDRVSARRVTSSGLLVA